MSDLTEFLLARIAERKAAAEVDRYDELAAHTVKCGYDQIEFGGGCECGGPARVLAECEAKRRIVLERPWPIGRPWDIVRAWHDTTLRILAAVYADHPDYRQEWKP